MIGLIKIINTGFPVFLISEHEQVAITTLYSSYISVEHFYSFRAKTKKFPSNQSSWAEY